MKVFRNLNFQDKKLSFFLKTRFLALVLLILMTLFFPHSSLSAQVSNDASLTLDEYHQYLTQTLAELEGIQGDSDDIPIDLDQLTALQEELTAVETVIYPSGETVTLQPIFTSEMLPQPDMTDEQQLQNLEIIIARIKIVREQIAASENDKRAERLDVLEEVFSRPVFNPQPSLWQRFRNWLRDLLERFWPQQSDNGSPLGQWITQIVAWSVAIAGGLLAIWLLSYWLRGLLGNFIADAETRRRRESDELILTATETRTQAVQLAQVGNYRQAVRQLYLSALLGLEERGVIRYDRSLTNREVLAQSQLELQDHLQPIVDTFDDVWYGIQEPDQNTFIDYQQEIDALEQMPEERRDSNEKNKVQ